MGCLERGADTQQPVWASCREEEEIGQDSPRFLRCALARAKHESRRAAVEEAQILYLTASESDNLAVDGWMGFCDAAAADTGEPHASREACACARGQWTHHTAPAVEAVVLMTIRNITD